MPKIARAMAIVWLGAAPLCLAGEAFWPEPPVPDSSGPGSAAQPRESAGFRSQWQSPSVSRAAPNRGVEPALFESPAPEVSPPGLGEERRPIGNEPGTPKVVPVATPSVAPSGLATGQTPRPDARQFHLPLGSRSARQERTDTPAKRHDGVTSAVTIVSSLAIVLGLFCLVIWVMRRAQPRGSLLLPTEVVEVLGRTPLAGRQQMHLVRCGSKLLLVAATPDSAETLTEIDDPDEATRLAGLCRQVHPHSASTTFRQVFDQLSGGGPMLGFFARRRAKDAFASSAELAWKEDQDG